uniref:Lactate/malate dehydrogenase N-terminal domain-containing protein n=1 Tax=Calidris pygmaea TaxID=425635 RepID=A0A8C3JZM4_9CHAR
MSTLKEKLITPVAAGAKVPNTKISIVGAGQVGMACAISVLAKVGLVCVDGVLVVLEDRGWSLFSSDSEP